MPQVRVYGRAGHLELRAPLLSNCVHEALKSALGIQTERRFHLFAPLPVDRFIAGPGRSDDYTLIEICLFQGRSTDAKHRLYRELYERIGRDAGIQAIDLEIMLFEIPRENWAIHGVPGDRMELGYDVAL